MIHRSVTIGIIILTAVYAALILKAGKGVASIRNLLNSSSELDVKEGIKQSKQLHYDVCKPLLTPFILEGSKYTTQCEDVLIEIAFRDGMVRDLNFGGLTTPMNEVLRWWLTENTHLQEVSEPIPEESKPWLLRLWSLQQEEIDVQTLLAINTTPFHDRDGSVLIAVLALHKHTPLQERSATMASLLDALDSDDVRAGLLLSEIWNEPIDDKRFNNNDELNTIVSVLQSRDTALAWRTLHNEDGTIRPDQMLAGLIVNPVELLPLFIESAFNEQWQHPEHAIELARWIRPSIAQRLPTQGLTTVKSRLDWWRKFKCGYLIEQGFRND